MSKFVYDNILQYMYMYVHVPSLHIIRHDLLFFFSKYNEAILHDFIP